MGLSVDCDKSKHQHVIRKKNGSYQANRSEIHWRQSAKKTTCDKSCTKKCSRNWRCEETTQIQAGNSSITRNSYIKNLLNCYYASCLSNVWSAKLHKISRLIFGFNPAQSWLCKKLPRLI